MWFFLLWLGFAVWVFFDAKKRCMKNPTLEAVGVLILGVIFLPIYFAKRNLYKGEVREGGMAWNTVKVFALYWTVTMFVASLAGLGAASQTVVKQTSEAAQAGAAIGTMLGMGLMIGLWFAVLVGALVIGLFLKKSSMVENGPTGRLAEQENPPKKLGVASLVVWAIVVSLTALVAGGKDGGQEEKISGNTSKISAGASVASEPLPAPEVRFIEIVSAAQRESHAAANDMQRGGIKAKRDRALCEVITSAATDWIGTIEEVDSNSDGKGVLEIAVAEGIKIKTWNNALSDVGNNTLIEPGSPVFEAASAMRKGQRVAFSGIFFRGLQGDCIQEASMSLRGKLEEPEFIFRFSKVSANIPTQHPQAAEVRKASMPDLGNVIYPTEPGIVVLQGRLVSFPAETPNGEKVTYPAIQLEKPITVSGDDAYGNSYTAKGIDLMQLVLDKKTWGQYEALKGKAVSVKGTLFHQDGSPYHRTAVLMTPAEMSQVVN